MLITPISFAVLQFLLLGVVMLMDQQSQPSFPRWFGYFTAFIGFDTLGGGFAVLTETGPFAWNGALAYFVPFGSLFAWAGGAIYFLIRSVDREWDAQGVMSAA